MESKQYKRYTITTALPYANGPVHIGHLAGVYIPADIYVRYLRANNRDVVFIGGSDEHGVPITIKARKEGVSPQQIVDKYHGIIKKSFQDFGISFDIYSRTSNKIHHKTASDFFEKLYKDGAFIEKTTQQYYDQENNMFLADRYITGTCPHCNNERAYGDQCESCGTSLNATDLINPKSAVSGNVPIMKDTKHWYLPLDKYEPWLKEWIIEGHKGDWRPTVYGQCKSWLDSGLHPRAVTRDLDWGVKVPVENSEGKVLYVWFDAPIGYISATKELTDDWEKYWKDEETKLVHFIGKDNIVFHCIIFPAMLKAEGSFILPNNVPSNEFLNLEGDKISTSRNWAIWLHEYLVDFPEKQDVLRYVLTANAPETKDNDFTWKDFQTRNNSELVAIIGNFVNRALVLTQKYYNGKVPPKNTLSEIDEATLAEIKTFPQRISNAIENYHFREGLREVMNLARLGNKYLADTEPWKLIKTDEKRVETILNISLQIVANLTILANPFLPFSMDKLRKMINMDLLPWQNAGDIDLIKPSHIINTPSLLFQQIENQEIEKQIARLQEIKNDNEKLNFQPEAVKQNIQFEDFSKLDLRIGTIITAEKLPKTKKLLKLTVDIGTDKRTIVSGIAEHFLPEEIIGKQVTVVANLAPKTIQGIESKGMILMAENNQGKLVFVSPTTETINGCGVK